MSKREELVEWARSQVGSNDRAGYWLKALGRDPGQTKHWCGAFFLAGLHSVGLALHHKWGINGSGLQALRMPQVRRPEPGDMGYDDTPYQHHFLVETVGTETYTSIDGNQGMPGVQRRNRAFKTPGVVFYSIGGLLHDTEPQLPAVELPTIRLGSTGEAVRALQDALNIYQNAGLVVDGAFGPRTARAVQTFQRDRGLDADGVCGPKTWAELERVT